MASNKHSDTLQYYTELLDKKYANGGMYLVKPTTNIPYDPSNFNFYTQNNNTTTSQPVKFGNIAYKQSVIQPKSSTNVVPQQLAPSHENDPKYQYFNPKEDVNATSGNKLEDMVYHNQWLLDTPVVGNIIKNKAKEYASSSGRAPIITDDLSKMQQDKNNVYTGGTGKIDLLKQYFDKQGLSKSQYTPTSNYLNFLPSYSIKNNFNTMRDNDKNKLVQNMINQQLNQTAGNYNNTKDPYSEAYNNFLKTKKPLYTQNDFDTDITNELGVNLGGHKTGMAYDDNVKLPYVSVSDAWDFSPDNYTKKWASKDNQDKARIQSTLMQKSGNPFKIYDRFYFDPNTKQYIPDDQVSQLKKKLGITPQVEQEQNVKSNVQSWLSSHKYADGHAHNLPKYEDGGSIDPYVKSWFSNPVTLNKLSSQLNSGDSSYFTKVANDAVQSLPTTLNKAKIFPINSTLPNISGNGQEEWNEDVNTAKNTAENKGYSRVSDSFFGILKNPNDNVKLSTILTGISNPMNYLNNKDKEWYPNVMDVRNKLNAVPGTPIKLQELDKIKNDNSYKYLKNIHGSDNDILNVLNTVAQNSNKTNNLLRI